MPRGGCATGGRECAPHAHQESKTSGNKRKTERKRKDERKTDRWAKEGKRGESPGRGRGVGWGQFFFFVWCQISHLHHVREQIAWSQQFFKKNFQKSPPFWGIPKKSEYPQNCKFHCHPPRDFFFPPNFIHCVIYWMKDFSIIECPRHVFQPNAKYRLYVPPSK